MSFHIESLSSNVQKFALKTAVFPLKMVIQNWFDNSLLRFHKTPKPPSINWASMHCKSVFKIKVKIKSAHLN